MEARQTTTESGSPAASPDLSIPPALAPWFRGYDGNHGRYDELLKADGSVRPAWEGFLRTLSKIRREDFVQRWADAQQLIRENGVTYNVYGDEGGTERPWELDPVPLVLSASEWEKIETALIQRAKVFDHLLVDCYGSRSLIKRRIIPPEVLYANPRYQRPCVGLPLPDGRWLHMYSADIARAEDGRWWVLSDRTQAPSGMGYALENRVIQSRMIPEVARECRLVRLAGYFRQVHDMLVAAAPRPKENPRIVLLTPGPHNETYFEHAFLARYLGITLVEGGDLAVRDEHVYLKTLDGLQLVDVILRRLDDGFADPLELLRESQIGVAGLLQAIRRKHVAVVNPPGSGLAEAPALLPFLPNVCRKVFGEELLMPSIATWWCGQAAERDAALARSGELVIKDAFDPVQPARRFGKRGDPVTRQRLEHDIRTNGFDFVAQEEMTFSTVPVWSDPVFEPRAMSLRVHLVATEDGYAVMPGGMARIAAEGHDGLPSFSMQGGSGSKDTWVVSDEAVPQHRSVYDAQYPIEMRRSTTDFPSRAADNLFWLGRYAERSEFAARLLRQVLARITGDLSFGALPDVAPLWSTLTGMGHLVAPSMEDQPAALGVEKLERAVNAAVFDATQVGSLSQLHEDLLRLASISRDALSLDTWRIVQDFTKALRRRPVKRLIELVPVLDRLISLHAALAGMASENTTRTQGWRFLDIGRRLERSVYLSRLGALSIRDHEGFTSMLPLESVLEVIDSTITFRRRNFFSPRLLPVLDLLLYDPLNPRSLAFQLERVDRHLSELPAERPDAFATEARRIVTRLLAETRATNLAAADAAEEQQQVQAVNEFLETLDEQLDAISNDLTRVYFSVLSPEQTPFASNP